jgi:hypothetical protein
MDPVHSPVEIFHGFFDRKTILQIPNIAGALDFYKNTLELFKIIF